MAYLPGYSKYKVLTITGGASGALTDYQLKIAVSYEAAMQGDFDDIRFTQADGTTLVDAWAEVIITDTSATVWVEFPTTPANTVEQIYRMYYGNAGAASDWDISATFLFSDDFEDGDTTNSGDLFVTASNKASTSQARSGTYSMATVNLDGFNSVALGTLALGTVSVIRWVYCASSSGRQTSCHISDGTVIATDSGQYFKFDGGNLYSYNGSAWVDTGLNYNIGWNKLEIIPQTGTTHDVILNDGTPVTGLTNRNTITDVDRIGEGGNTSESTAYRDDYCVRKYVTNPPTYAFGGEESAPTGIMPVLSHLYNQMRQ